MERRHRGRRADGLTTQGKLAEAQAAHDKAQFSRVYATKIETQASESETKSVPGADELTMTSGETKVSSN